MAVELGNREQFADRHIGPDADDEGAMLRTLGVGTLAELVAETIPTDIRFAGTLDLPAPVGEAEVLDELRALAAKNDLWKSFIGLGYSNCFLPPVIQRNILENPGWYTQYTPYQAEISQGRLEALLNYQTMVADLTGLAVANASLLDEATAAAEAMHMLHALAPALEKEGPGAPVFLVSDSCHPQTISVVKTRARPLGIEVRVGDAAGFDFSGGRVFGVLLQYPATDGGLPDWRDLARRAHDAGALVAMATDLLALTVLTPPGELGADVAIGSAQRFGVPLGYGGPHAAFFATRSEWVRKLPGRLIGVAEDAHGHMALRMALQTREQHIRREKATSNICTAQVLLAMIARMYAVYHGPRGLRAIAERVGGLTAVLARGLERLGLRVRHRQFFDTVRVDGSAAELAAIVEAAAKRRVNLRRLSDTAVTVSLDETTTAADVRVLLEIFGRGGRASGCRRPGRRRQPPLVGRQRPPEPLSHPSRLQHAPLGDGDAPLHASARSARSLAHPRHDPARLLHHEAERDGRDAAGDLAGLGRPAPLRAAGTSRRLPGHLLGPGAMLAAITGFAATSLQPNAGSQGEYAGLLVIRAYHESRGQGHRDVCLIPSSAHGTNPASAAMAGYRVVVVACDDGGNIDVGDLEAKARAHADKLAALMVTYPSTHGVFEAGIKRVTEIVHAHGGQVYMDGANMNAQVGLSRPADIGADVCHINLHKTFCIPHGGGGPGMGPICVATHLAPFLPGHPIVATGGDKAIGPVSAAPWGSASILLISWMYIRLMGAAGLTRATEVAILNANYIAKRLEPHYPVVYKGGEGPRRARVHRRRAPVEEAGRHRGGRHGQAPHGLRLPRPHHVLPHPGHADDRADGKRIEGRAGSLLRRHDRDPRRDRRDRTGHGPARGQPPEERPAHGGGTTRHRVAAPLPARTGRLPAPLRPRGKVLAAGRPPQQRPRRPQALLLLPRHLRLRLSAMPFT